MREGVAETAGRVELADAAAIDQHWRGRGDRGFYNLSTCKSARRLACKEETRELIVWATQNRVEIATR